jgi:hypothetical protein
VILRYCYCGGLIVHVRVYTEKTIFINEGGVFKDCLTLLLSKKSSNDTCFLFVCPLVHILEIHERQSHVLGACLYGSLLSAKYEHLFAIPVLFHTDATILAFINSPDVLFSTMLDIYIYIYTLYVCVCVCVCVCVVGWVAQSV